MSGAIVPKARISETRKMILKAILLLFCGLGLVVAGLWTNWQLSTPRQDRDWQPLYATLPTVEGAAVYQLTNVRNWVYRDDKTTIPGWLDVTLDPGELVNIYLLVKPFGTMRAVAHTMLAFEFSDGAGYVASVEARREVGEDYGGLKAGVFPLHEYMIVWATERDMYLNNTVLGRHELYAYRLELTVAAKQAVLTSILDETRALQDQPRFYNTFLSNCTNVLARAVNKVLPDAVPWSIAWHLPGYAPDFLHRKGLIDAPNGMDALRDQSRITHVVESLTSVDDPVAFATAFRALVWKQ